MSTLHAIAANLVTTGTLYGWRLDALVLGALGFLLLTGYERVASPSLLLSRAAR